MNKFNKLDFLVSVGLVNARFNYVSLKFERSISIRLWCYLNSFLKFTFPFKIFLSMFFAREDRIQL